jgi:hypothetical protein
MTIESDFKEWDREMTCIPTWNEMLEIEYFRQKGDANMFSNWQRLAYDLGLYCAVTWLQRCKENRISPAFAYDMGLDMWQPKKGLRSTWITEEIKDEFIARELSSKGDAVRRELEALQARIQGRNAK